MVVAAEDCAHCVRVMMQASRDQYGAWGMNGTCWRMWAGGVECVSRTWGTRGVGLIILRVSHEAASDARWSAVIHRSSPRSWPPWKLGIHSCTLHSYGLPAAQKAQLAAHDETSLPTYLHAAPGRRTTVGAMYSLRHRVCMIAVFPHRPSSQGSERAACFLPVRPRAWARFLSVQSGNILGVDGVQSELDRGSWMLTHIQLRRWRTAASAATSSCKRFTLDLPSKVRTPAVLAARTSLTLNTHVTRTRLLRRILSHGDGQEKAAYLRRTHAPAQHSCWSDQVTTPTPCVPDPSDFGPEPTRTRPDRRKVALRRQRADRWIGCRAAPNHATAVRQSTAVRTGHGGRCVCGAGAHRTSSSICCKAAGACAAAAATAAAACGSGRTAGGLDRHGFRRTGAQESRHPLPAASRPQRRLPSRNSPPPAVWDPPRHASSDSDPIAAETQVAVPPGLRPCESPSVESPSCRVSVAAEIQVTSLHASYDTYKQHLASS